MNSHLSDITLLTFSDITYRVFFLTLRQGFPIEIGDTACDTIRTLFETFSQKKIKNLPKPY